MNPLMERIYGVGITPVVSLNNEEKAVGLADAMLRGGLPVLEVAFREEFAARSLAAIRKACPDMIAGAGTILTTEQADLAIHSGAMFLVSPGFDEQLVEHCIKKGVDIIPGVSTASEIQKALGMGLTILKFFPARTLGGLDAINYLAAPFMQAMFLPAGGCDFDNLAEYFHNRHIFACAGGFVARASHIEGEEWDIVTALCRKARRKALDFSLSHVGINCEDEKEALAGARELCCALDGEIREGNSSIFADDAVEFMKTPYLGRNGHIGFSTSSVERALAFLEERRIEIRQDSIRYNECGLMQSAYLMNEIGDFAVHVVRAKP